ncbi:hypothetical protein TD95_002947 [Thielaviopsis punctulata]|uniref:Eukaryotic translation initiation factor 2A n=1 Tax=Thielaviopsis punctulata TaxID=72032 RepID=A0A0F4ZLH8_9PEZI|nr:hypothetical protein TD95_002947 [Thielaviopsis punctulata]
MAPLQFAYRTQNVVNVFDAAPDYKQNSGFVRHVGASRCCAYSPCGRFFAWSSNEAVSVHDATSGSVVFELPIPTVIEIGFSPKGTFLITLERPGKDEAGDATKNLKIWRTDDQSVNKQPMGCFVQKSHSDFNLQYTADEKYCARLVTNEVQFYLTDNLNAVSQRLRVEGVSQFALSPGASHSIAVFVPERKGQPAAIKVFNVPLFNNPVSQKTFFKGDKVKLSWNKQGSSILVLAQTDVDKTNKSYYGESTLYLLSSTGGFEGRVTLDKEGPIHHFDWSPNSKEFGVVYGFMPAKAKIFNSRATPTHEFPTCPRNEIFFSPNGRFALVAGLGNLAGQIDIYDLEKDYRKLCTIESGNPSVCEWSADSRFIMTATLSPRLRVDNGVKLWHVSGTLMYNEDMTELLQISWKPVAPNDIQGGDPVTPIPTPHASAASYLSTRKAPSKPAGAYRPPGARGMATPLHFKREDEGGSAHVINGGISQTSGPTVLNGFGRTRRAVPGAELAEPAPRTVPGAEPVDENLSKTALKNKKKRNKKAKDSAVKSPEPNDGVSLTAPTNGGRGSADNRSPERRNGQGSNGRSRSRNPNSRSRSNTTRSMGGALSPNSGDVPVPNLPAPGATPAGGETQSPITKKIRGLQKKLRAIEELEMRLARGEKLEDTQMKKISTRDAVMTELNALGE